ncbi:hypothetical protein SUGI_0927960 [Cryptomeria japonica]|nr:hypothetical protein SUGI_0927960 [Cryptomeria japonica]
MAEVIGRSIKRKVGLGLWKGVSISDSLDPISHSQFADDTILFGEASVREAKVIQGVLEEYKKDSGQSMNRHKSTLYFINVSKKFQMKIVSVLQFGISQFPIKYLGVPLFVGRLDNKIWEEVVNRCKVKSMAWTNNWLSQAGRIQMVKTILSAVPIYYMSCYGLSCKAASTLDGLLKKFLCDGEKELKKVPLINWDTACMLKAEGGTELRHMKLQNVALGAKLVWKLFSSPNKGWSKVMIAKYIDSDELERIFTMANAAGGSLIWKFLWESQRIIIDHLSWKIENGKKAKFWRDSWNYEEALIDLLEDKDWIL